MLLGTEKEIVPVLRLLPSRRAATEEGTSGDGGRSSNFSLEELEETKRSLGPSKVSKTELSVDGSGTRTEFPKNPLGNPEKI